MTAMAILFGLLGLGIGMLSLWFTTEAMRRMDRLQGVKAGTDPDPKGEIARLETLARDLERRLGKMEIETRPEAQPRAERPRKPADPTFVPSRTRDVA
jgi:hypothetical protein